MTFIVRVGLLVAATSLLAVACSKTDSATTNQANQANQTRPAGSAASPASQSTDEFAATRVIYAKECVSCHGADGNGGPVKLEDGTTLRVPSLREGHALKHKDEEFVKQITKGGDGMPKFEDKLSREQILDLARFIRKEFQGK
jgi:mono/diheme cytochrome c family protein